MMNKNMISKDFLRSVGMSAALVGVLAAGTVAHVAVADEAGSGTQTENSGDPLEQVNRFTSGFNRAVRGALIDPLIDGYQYVTPEPVQNSVSNFFSNLSEPVTAVSSLLQGDTENAENATGRFFVNSTLGVGGLNDPATGMGMVQRREDLGQAMAVNGMNPGPHIVLPILGPSNLRDATGDILTGLASPLPLAVQAADGGVRYSTYQDDIQALERGALDPYVAEREAYEQNREYQVSNGNVDGQNFPALADGEGPTLATNPQ
ncbi:MAG: VacJ family lipoprotein [Rhodospirillales bacterium]|nr:VacJ family lipoprotein [Rhodospirillales bacterium]MBO6786877.1 VacJ family lipoprotein [Rhodospirillales bacterium]